MSSTSRRSFLGGALAALPLPALVAGKGRILGSNRWGPQEYSVGRASEAVLDLAFGEIAEVRALAGHGLGRRDEHLGRLAKATSLFFAHFQEIGALDALDRQAIANGEAAVEDLNEAGLSLIYNELAARRVTIPLDVIRVRFARRSRRRKQRTLDGLRASGVYEFSKRLCRAMEAQAGAIEAGRRRNVSLQDDGGLADKLCDGLTLIAALLAVGCVVGIVPYCAGAALVYLLESVLEYIGFCE